jgi:hypothetical protein
VDGGETPFGVAETFDEGANIAEAGLDAAGLERVEEPEVPLGGVQEGALPFRSSSG